MQMRGDIVSRKVHEDMKTDRDYWREAHGVSEQARQVLNRQNDALIEVGRTVEAIANAIRVNIDLPDGQGGPKT
jgi:hypothetical protein